MARLSFVTTCKGRLHHLRESLPRLLAQQDCECVVVDYGCPDGTALWVRAHYPQVKLVESGQTENFQIGHARNLGAAVASSEWLGFVDADILLAPEFATVVVPQLQKNAHYGPDRFDRNTCGTHLCLHEDYVSIGGCDEVMRGWGSDDDDLYRRLTLLGRHPATFAAALLHPLPNDESQRGQFHEISDLWLNQRINAFYLEVKHDLMRMSAALNLPLEVRTGLYAAVRRATLEAAGGNLPLVRIEVTLPERQEFLMIDSAWKLRRRWIYDLSLNAGPPSDPIQVAD